MLSSNRVRLALALAAVASGAMTHEIWDAIRQHPAPSLFLWATFAGAIITVLGFTAAAAFLRERDVTRVRAMVSRLTVLPRAEFSKPLRHLLLFLAGLLLAGNLATHWATAPPVNIDDQGAFLYSAGEIRTYGGLGPFWFALRNGEFREANRHPFYPWLLSSGPSELRGRATSCVIGVLTFVLCCWMVARRFSWSTAAVFALLLALNRSFAQYATMIVCEPLMILFGALAIFILLPRSGRAASAGSPTTRILTAAAFLGFLYLTKATGLLFMAAFLLWLTWEARPRNDDDGLDRRASDPLLPSDTPYQFRRLVVLAGSSIVAFLIVVHPLIERNVRVYGNPFYNVNSLLLFAERYEEFDRMMARHISTGEAARAWWASHSLLTMFRREVSGLVWEAFIMLRALGFAGLDDARVLIGLPLALCALLGMAANRGPGPRLILVWTLTAWIVFAWYVPIAAGDRFPIPLLCPVLAYAADGIVRLMSLKRCPATASPAAPAGPADSPA